MHTYSFLAFAQSPEFKQLPLHFADGERGRFLKLTWNTGIKRKLWFSKLAVVLWSREKKNPVFQSLKLTSNIICSVLRQLLSKLASLLYIISQILFLISNCRWHDKEVYKTVWNWVSPNPLQTALKVYWTLSTTIVSLTATRIIVLQIKHCLSASLIEAKYKLISWPLSTHSLLVPSWYETLFNKIK